MTGSDDTLPAAEATSQAEVGGEKTAAPARKSPGARLRNSVIFLLLLYALGGIAVGYAYWRVALYPKSPNAAIGRLFAAVNQRNYQAMYAALNFEASSAGSASPELLKTLCEANPKSLPKVSRYVVIKIQTTEEGAIAEAEARFEGEETKPAKLYIPLKHTSSGWKVAGAWLMGEIARRSTGL